MNRRSLLKLLPVVAVTATTVKVGDISANAYELQPEKKYLILIPTDITPEQAKRMSELVRTHFGPSSLVVAGEQAADLKVYELQ